jgi:hypothetical protein
MAGKGHSGSLCAGLQDAARAATQVTQSPGVAAVVHLMPMLHDPPNAASSLIGATVSAELHGCCILLPS